MVTLVDVALTPALLSAGPTGVSVLVDALEAGPLVLALFERGARRVLLPGRARVPAVPAEAVVLAGLVGPEAAAPAEVADRDVLLATRSAASVREVAARSAQTYLGALPNLSAVARASLAAAQRTAQPLVLVCAPPAVGRGPGLENAYAAGLLVRRLREVAVELRAPVELADGALLVQALYDHFASPLEAFRRSAAGRALQAAGRESALERAAALDASPVVPEVADPSAARYPLVLL